MQKFNITLTDTLNGEPNYSEVKRGSLTVKENESPEEIANRALIKMGYAATTPGKWEGLGYFSDTFTFTFKDANLMMFVNFLGYDD